MKMRRPAILKIAFRKNNKVVVLHRGRVVCKCNSTSDAKLFIQGWRDGEAEAMAIHADPEYISGFVDAQAETAAKRKD